MKRDMDLVRELLLALENASAAVDLTADFGQDAKNLGVEGDPAIIRHHFDILEDAELIKVSGMYDGQPAFMKGQLLQDAMLRGSVIRSVRLTWQGHEFLDAVRDPEIWRKTKGGAAEAKGFTFDLLRDLAKGLIKKQIEEYTGVEL